MADFVKKTWACDDIITADELNRMEGGIEEALDKGYSCTEEWVTLTDESVTTELDGDACYGTLTYSTSITADTIRVTFDGVEYSCPLLNDGSYGAPYDPVSLYDWSEYPFNLSIGLSNMLITQTAGTYQIKVEVLEETVEVSECFEKAVATLLPNTARVSYSYGTITGATPTAREAWGLLENGKMERVIFANDYEFSSYHVAYLDEKNGHLETAPYSGVEVYGTYYRFKALPYYDEENGLQEGTHIDVFHPDNTDEYYWVFSGYYAGKHE